MLDQSCQPLDAKKAPKGLKTQILTSYLRFIVHTVHNDPSKRRSATQRHASSYTPSTTTPKPRSRAKRLSRPVNADPLRNVTLHHTHRAKRLSRPVNANSHVLFTLHRTHRAKRLSRPVNAKKALKGLKTQIRSPAWDPVARMGSGRPHGIRSPAWDPVARTGSGRPHGVRSPAWDPHG